MTKYDLTFKQILDKVVEIGNRFPDFKYTNQGGTPHTCSYVHGGFCDPEDEDSLDYIPGQGCIVGQALRALGVSKDDLVKNDLGGTANEIILKLTDDYDPERGRLLDTIQSLQDGGVVWGEAVNSVVV